ncbi:MAG: hypothetical protein ABI841_00555 [Chloroflexota bacterium]
MGIRRRRPAILVGMGETAGYLTQLVAGFRGVGVRADFLNLADDPFGYDNGPRPRWSFRLARWLSRRNADRRRPRPLWAGAYAAVMVALFVGAIVRYDTFVFRAGNSFFRLHELRLLRLLGKRVVVVFFGSDSRPSYMNGWEVTRGIVGQRAVAATAAKRQMVARTEQHASVIVCHVLSAQLHRRRAVAFLDVGFPRPVETNEEAPAARSGGRPVRVLHAPSNPASKGTQAIRDAVQAVQAQGVRLELVVVSARPNSEVLEAIRACDFVVDEIYSDSPMAGFAAEAAAVGRPAIVGGYGWDELKRVTSPDAMPPAHLSDPAGLADAILLLASDETYRMELGARARRFMEENWSPEAVARRFLALIERREPEAWTFDPADVAYAHGTGIAEDGLREVLAGVLEAGGRAGLCVADKPRLEQRLVDLAGPLASPC